MRGINVDSILMRYLIVTIKLYQLIETVCQSDVSPWNWPSCMQAYYRPKSLYSWPMKGCNVSIIQAEVVDSISYYQLTFCQLDTDLSVFFNIEFEDTWNGLLAKYRSVSMLVAIISEILYLMKLYCMKLSIRLKLVMIFSCNLSSCS